MSKHFKLFAFAVIAFMSVGVSGANSQTSSKMSADEKAVRQIIQQVQDAWNAHDGKAFAEPFAENADYVVVNGMYAKGRDAIEKGHTQIFTTIYKDSRNAATIKSVRFLRPDVAVVLAEWNLEFKIGGEMKKGHAMNTMVMTRDNGKWSIAAFQNTPIETERR